MSDPLSKEANSLWNIGRILLDGDGDYDAEKLGHLLDAIRNCAERSKQAGQDEGANSLNDIATKLTGRARKTVAD